MTTRALHVERSFHANRGVNKAESARRIVWLLGRTSRATVKGPTGGNDKTARDGRGWFAKTLASSEQSWMQDVLSFSCFPSSSSLFSYSQWIACMYHFTYHIIRLTWNANNHPQLFHTKLNETCNKTFLRSFLSTSFFKIFENNCFSCHEKVFNFSEKIWFFEKHLCLNFLINFWLRGKEL